MDFNLIPERAGFTRVKDLDRLKFRIEETPIPDVGGFAPEIPGFEMPAPPLRWRQIRAADERRRAWTASQTRRLCAIDHAIAHEKPIPLGGCRIGSDFHTGT